MPVDKDLIHINAILEGDKNAFAPLVEKYKDMTYTLCVNLLQNNEIAEEIAQDIFVKAYQSLSKFKKKSKFSTWLYRIAYNECISNLRRKSPVKLSLDETYQIVDFVENAVDNEKLIEHKRKHLNKAISILPELDRIIVLLHYYESMSLEDIAGITMLTKSNVKIKLFRARKKLFNILAPIFEKEAIFLSD